jgi:hypothetical protein
MVAALPLTRPCGVAYQSVIWSKRSSIDPPEATCRLGMMLLKSHTDDESSAFAVIQVAIRIARICRPPVFRVACGRGLPSRNEQKIRCCGNILLRKRYAGVGILAAVRQSCDRSGFPHHAFSDTSYSVHAHVI